MPSGYDAYKIYHAIDLHFTTPSFDYIKYQGKSNANPNMWYRRPDRYHFEVLGAKYKEAQLIGIFVSYFVQGVHVKKPYNAELTAWARDGYPRWLSDTHALPRIFERDLSLMKERATLKQLFVSKDGQLPPFVQMLINKDINPATAVIIIDLIKEVGPLLDKIDDDVLWPSARNLIYKYKPFLTYDKDKYADILQTVFKRKTKDDKNNSNS